MDRSSLLALLLLPACGPVPLEPRDPTPGSFHFTVQSFNVEVWHHDDDSTIEAVGREDADIVCLQETGNEWDALLRERYAEQYPHMVFHSELDSGGIGVLSRFPIEDLGLIESPGEWHPAWRFRVETPEGPMQILHVHLRSILSGRGSGAEAYLKVDEDHTRQIRVFSSTLDWDLPTLAIGDFNEEPDGPAVEYLEARGFTNILPLFHPGQGTWRKDSVGGQFEKTLDHILFGDDFRPLNAWVERWGNSDHFPVFAHIEARESFRRTF